MYAHTYLHFTIGKGQNKTTRNKCEIHKANRLRSNEKKIGPRHVAHKNNKQESELDGFQFLLSTLVDT